MKDILLSFIADAVGVEYAGADITVHGISTDTRTIKNGEVYLCLSGERFNGHDFAGKAVENGAVAIVASEKVDVCVPVLYVENTLSAYMKIAAAYRRLFTPIVVGITGSVGKTSTKEMVFAALSGSYNTLKTEGNLNSEIGLSATVLNLNEKYEAAVIEMGMQNLGEIDVLTKVASPQIGVITNIGVCHIENLKTRENILKAKLEIENGLPENGVLVICSDNDLLLTTKGKLKHKAVYYGINRENADVYADNIETTDNSVRFVIHKGSEEYPAEVPAIGKHNVLNALAAFCVCDVLGLDKEKSVKSLSDFKNTGKRQNILKFDDITVIEDCYNASPDSMKASLEVLKCFGGKRKIAVLADMLELGEISEEMHKAVGEYAGFCDKVFAYGNYAKFIADASGGRYFDDKKKLAEAIKNEAASGDVILFKGSRGMKLEEVIDMCFERGENQ